MKDGERSQGEGRRVCLGGRIYSIPCRASYFALVYLEEQGELNLFFQIVWGKTAGAAKNWINSAPQTDATTFAFASLSILLLCPSGKVHINSQNDLPKTKATGLRLCQWATAIYLDGNTSSCKITEVKQLGPRLTLHYYTTV